MKIATKLTAMLLAVVMCLGIFTACGSTKTLVVGYSPFSSKFSPFFSETAYDQDAYVMTQLGLLSSDRTGAIIYKGIKGETINYNGTDYTYYGPADLTVTENADGTVYYDFTLRKDLKFSDGEKLTVDDIIFSMYVLCDPTYDGSSTLFAQPIKGMEEYRSGMDSLLSLLLKAGRDNKDFTYFTQEQQTAFWASIDATVKKFAAALIDEIIAKYGAAYNVSDAAGATALWGFSGCQNADDFAAALVEKYGDDIESMNDEQCSSSVWSHMDDYDNYLVGVTTGESAANIEGIQKIDDYNLRIVMTKIDATAIYHLGISIAPMHYYGEASKYDYANNKFGFDKGDLTHVRSVTTQPMGAGPYKFIKFENGVISYEANKYYYLGEPKTKYVNFLQCLKDDDKLNGVTTGTVDITDPSFSTDTIKAIEAANGGSLNGDKVVTNTVDNLGYGYIGMCAKVMNVGGQPGSDASKALRKAFGTIFSVYRDVAIDSYYGDRASVINYPISNTSWAAPRSADEGYKVAFSVDADGKDIYTSSMSAEDKYAAAKTAALGFFQKAGYTVADGKVTAAPEGAKLEYQAWIPADGTGDHPAFQIFTEAKKALAEIGITLDIKDLSDSSELWTALRAQSVAIWAAAWGATVDPDMYQIYFSGDNTHDAGGSNYQYAIDDKTLNTIILDARSTTDQAARKLMYKEALDIIIDWAVEIPTYQRQNAIIFNPARVNMKTVTPDITTFYGWMAEIQNLKLK